VSASGRQLVAQSHEVRFRERAAVPVELGGYLGNLVSALASVADLDAVYLIGSAASGGYEHGRGDVDVVAVTSRSLAPDERRLLVAAAEAVPCPARKLELVVYPRGSDAWEINLNTGEHVSYDPADEPSFWFVIDRAVAESHAVPLVGSPWREVFAPVPHETLLAALADSLDSIGLPGAVRAWAWTETDAWLSKPAAADWLRERVRRDLQGLR